MSGSDREREIIIIGGGPAGLTAALYGSRAGHSVLVLERAQSGGEITATDWVDNYPGFPDGISGFEYGQMLEKQARKFGAGVLPAALEEAELIGDLKKIVTSEGIFNAKKIIIATGTEPAKLGVAGETEFPGRGVSYCATCDAAFYRDKEAAVIGGGDAAAEEALFLARFARKVYLVHRRDRLRAVRSLQDKLFESGKIEILWNTVVQEIRGEARVRGIDLMQKESSMYLPVSGVFISIGRRPNSSIFKEAIETDRNGFIITDEEMRTSCPGVFAAGDVRLKIFRQVITAAADGAIAAYMAGRELQDL